MATVADLILKNKHFLDQFTNGINKRLIGELQKAQADILEELTRGDLGIKRRAHLRAVAAEATNILENAYGGFEDTILSGLSNAARQEYWSISNALRSQAGMEEIAKNAPLQGIPTQALKNILTDPVGGKLLKKWVDKQFAEADFQITRVLSQGMIQGQGINKMVSELKKQIEVSSRGAEVLIRTSVMDASNKALEQAYKDHSKLILKYRALATLDHRTCPVCVLHDGEEHKTFDSFTIRYPAHPSCRCIIIPITKYEQDTTMRPYKIIDEDGETKYGKVSAKTSYSEWFNGQDAEFQKSFLGPVRYRMYRDGELELKQFVKSDKVLTLNQLKERYDIDLGKFRKRNG